MPGKKEYEPNGMEIGRLPNQSDLVSTGGGGGGWSPGEIGGGWESMNCVWDGVNVPCGWLQHYQNQGGGGPVVEAPPDTTVAIWSNSLRRFVGLAVWNLEAHERGLAFLGRGSQGYLPTNVSYTPGSGLSGENVYQWFGGFPGGRLGSSDGNPNFISETSVQLHSMAQGIALNGANFQSPQQTQQQTLFPYHPSIEKRQLTKDEVAALRSRVEAMLDANDGKCKRYIEKLLDKTSELFPNGEDGNTIDVGSGLKTHLVLDVFDIVSEQGNFHFAYGNTVNMFRNKPEFNGARVWLGGNAGLDPQRRSSANLTAFQLSQAHVLDSLLTVTAIHELIHYNYNDNQLAYATAALKGERYTGTGFFGTSNYWGDELKRNCDPNWIEPKKK